MTSTFRLQHQLRMRYTTLLQHRATVGLTTDEAIEFALLREQLNAVDAPLYASLPQPLTAGVGIEYPPLVAKERDAETSPDVGMVRRSSTRGSR